MTEEYFTDDELRCGCGCEQMKFRKSTRKRLNKMRHELGFPFIVSSAYRCPEYNEKMGYTQTHATGQAVDIACSHAKAYKILAHAHEYGFTGIGVNQKGVGRFIHLDDLEQEAGRPRPHVWSY